MNKIDPRALAEQFIQLDPSYQYEFFWTFVFMAGMTEEDHEAENSRLRLAVRRALAADHAEKSDGIKRMAMTILDVVAEEVDNMETE